MAERPVRFRDAVAADAPAVAGLHLLSWRTAYRGILGDAYLDGDGAAAEREAVWRERLGGEARRAAPVVVLAEQAGAPDPIAFACVLPGSDPRWGSLVDNLHVRPDARRRRLGRAVLREAAGRLPTEHARTPLHLTVLEANAAAIAAYEGWGGRLAERLVERVGGSGETHPVRRYAWDSPAALVRLLSREP